MFYFTEGQALNLQMHSLCSHLFFFFFFFLWPGCQWQSIETYSKNFLHLAHWLGTGPWFISPSSRLHAEWSSGTKGNNLEVNLCMNLCNSWTICPIFNKLGTIWVLGSSQVQWSQFLPYWTFNHTAVFLFKNFHRTLIFSKFAGGDLQTKPHKNDYMDLSFSELFAHYSQSNLPVRLQMGNKVQIQQHFDVRNQTSYMDSGPESERPQQFSLIWPLEGARISKNMFVFKLI